MTLAQRKVFDAVVAYLQTNRCSPSYADIAKAAGLASLSTVYKHLCGLELGGLISFQDNATNRRGRSVQLTRTGAEFSGLEEHITVMDLRQELDVKNERIAELERTLREIRADHKVWELEENAKDAKRNQRVSAQAAGR